jgi:hypothetical protein
MVPLQVVISNAMGGREMRLEICRRVEDCAALGARIGDVDIKA